MLFYPSYFCWHCEYDDDTFDVDEEQYYDTCDVDEDHEPLVHADVQSQVNVELYMQEQMIDDERRCPCADEGGMKGVDVYHELTDAYLVSTQAS